MVLRLTQIDVTCFMQRMSERSDQPDHYFKNSALYQEFLAEREEILRHKWIESEKAGYDIGFEKALLDWIVRHRSAWRQTRQAQHSKQLEPAHSS
jgi:hypothetical protein